jgi:formylmethanofuran dehydrogenase subunit E
MEDTYCEECLENTKDENFDYRFERPVCQDCVHTLNLTPELTEGAY